MVKRYLPPNLALICLAASGKTEFTDDGRTDDGRTDDGRTDHGRRRDDSSYAVQ